MISSPSFVLQGSMPERVLSVLQGEAVQATETASAGGFTVLLQALSQLTARNLMQDADELPAGEGADQDGEPVPAMGTPLAGAVQLSPLPSEPVSVEIVPMVQAAETVAAAAVAPGGLSEDMVSGALADTQKGLLAFAADLSAHAREALSSRPDAMAQAVMPLAGERGANRRETVSGPSGEAAGMADVARLSVRVSPQLLTLLPSVGGEVGVAGMSSAQGTPVLPEWASVKLPTDKPAQWGNPLRTVLGERLQVQSAHGIDRALIRLDPQHLGTLEIAIRHEAGGVHVQLLASNSELVRQLQAISEVLRQDLSNRQFVQVSVDVREGAPGGQGQGQGQKQGESGREGKLPGRALTDAQGDGSGQFLLDAG